MKLLTLAVTVALALPSAGAAGGAPLPLPLFRLTPIAQLELPVAMAVRTTDADLYFGEKTGRVRAVRGGVLDVTPVLDIANEVSGDSEQGLLGIAFSPDGARLYVNYTDLAGDTRIVEFAMSGGYAVESSRRQLLFVDQPYANHNGGHIMFGPDGYLYIFLGDGGSGGDPQNNASNLGRLLGKTLRISPVPSGTLPYTIPATNPFVGVAGARGEIWAYGLRNPWRAGFDRLTGELWIADVGQDAWEEVNRQPAGVGGQNYGWRNMEGSRRYQNRPEPPNHTPPVYEYGNASAYCAVIGGTVYRGTRNPYLYGRYLLSDFCAGRIQALREVAGTYVAEELGLVTAAPSAFGEDHAGEVYVLSLAGTVSRIDPAIEP